MRRYQSAILVFILSASPVTALAGQKDGIRSVEIVPMGQLGSLRRSEPGTSEEQARLTTKFLLHDLSRQLVEYRMAQEFGSQSHVAANLPTVSPVSSIELPPWMKIAPMEAAHVIDASGCAPIGYRPAGFLKPEAEARRAVYYGLMSAIACEQGIPIGLFDAMIIRESRYNPGALSSKKALGLTQLMPGTASYLGVNPYDPAQNLRGGARYLREQLDRFGQVHLALAAYNAGPGRIKGGVIPQIAETRAYVADILGNWSRLADTPRIQEAGNTGSSRSRRPSIFSF